MAKEKGYTRRVGTDSDIESSSMSFKINDQSNLLYGKKNYVLILSGLGLMILGLILMAGGRMPTPDVWDESLIYSPVRITLAPLVILAGLGVQVYAVFAKKQ